ncbi:unknown [Parabacteroides sp. CAG:409]|nr:unknown [Parabacteroides sp. CAG:409]
MNGLLLKEQQMQRLRFIKEMFGKSVMNQKMDMNLMDLQQMELWIYQVVMSGVKIR